MFKTSDLSKYWTETDHVCMNLINLDCSFARKSCITNISALIINYSIPWDKPQFATLTIIQIDKRPYFLFPLQVLIYCLELKLIHIIGNNCLRTIFLSESLFFFLIKSPSIRTPIAGAISHNNQPSLYLLYRFLCPNLIRWQFAGRCKARRGRLKTFCTRSFLARQTRTSSSGLRSGARTRTMIDTGAKDALAGCRRARTWRTRKAETVQVYF